MIRINLYSNRSQKPTGTRPPAGGGGSGNLGSGDLVFEETSVKKDALVHLFAILLPVTALYVYQEQRIPGLLARERAQSQELVALQAENSKNSEIVEEAQRFNEEKARLEAQIRSIQRLSDGRMNVVKGLEVIQNSIPNKVWVSTLKLQDQRMLIEGTALTDLDISSFMERISSSTHLSDVDLLEAQQRESELVGPVKEFSINAQLEGGS